MFCILELRHCEDNPDTCKNGAKCISLTKDEGSYRCLCREGSSGRNCEYSEFHTVKPITVKPPAIIPITDVTEVPANTTIGEKEIISKQNTTESASTTTTEPSTSTEKLEPVISENET